MEPVLKKILDYKGLGKRRQQTLLTSFFSIRPLTSLENPMDPKTTAAILRLKRKEREEERRKKEIEERREEEGKERED